MFNKQLPRMARYYRNLVWRKTGRMLLAILAIIVTPIDCVASTGQSNIVSTSTTASDRPPTSTVALATATKALPEFPSTPVANDTIEPTSTVLSVPTGELVFNTRLPDGDGLSLLSLPSYELKDLLLNHSEIPNAYNPSLSPDGRYVTFDSINKDNRDGSDIYLLELETDKLTKLDTGYFYSEDATWSSNGQQLAFVGGPNANSSTKGIFVLNIGSGKVTRVASGLSAFGQLQWSADNNYIAYLSIDQINTISLNVINAHAVSNPTSLGSCGDDIRSFAWSPIDNAIVCGVGIDNSRDIFVKEFTPAFTQVRLIDGLFKNIQPMWSADGKRIIFASNKSGRFNIYTTNHDGKELEQLTDNQMNNLCPAWSSDGKYIFFTMGMFDDTVASIPGHWDLYSMTSDGKNLLHLASKLTQRCFSAWWSIAK